MAAQTYGAAPPRIGTSAPGSRRPRESRPKKKRYPKGLVARAMKPSKQYG